jgi:hypothetical protein
MSGASKSGNAYESVVARALSVMRYMDAPVVVWGVGGSDKRAPDIEAHVLDGPLVLEAKTRGAFEFGSKGFLYRNDRFELPDHPLFRACFPPEFRPFNGFVPAFARGDATQETLRRERKEQKALGNPLDVRVRLDDPLAASRFYAAKGVHYIQIEGYGLYRTILDDPRALGLPVLSMTMQVRYRIKTHKSNSKHSLQAQFVCFKKPERSPFDLDDPTRLPPGFSLPPVVSRFQTMA